ncbi:MAG: metallophosphoesterase family protein [Cyclobacteriaceae bacterium]|nr:metallophosphoesterase family protein [Cyclobacteriaceae bacterium]
MGRQFAISDIHGCSATFRKLVIEILRFTHEDTLFLLGDYVNKGPDSKGVLDFIFELLNSGHHVFCLKGNHEAYLLDALRDSDKESYFLARGGTATLQSFGVSKVAEIPVEYLNFMESLPLYFQLDKYFLVHAGFDFELPDPFNDEPSILNIRQFEVDWSQTAGRSIIHGHVPTTMETISRIGKCKSEPYFHRCGMCLHSYPLHESFSCAGPGYPTTIF